MKKYQLTGRPSYRATYDRHMRRSEAACLAAALVGGLALAVAGAPAAGAAATE